MESLNSSNRIAARPLVRKKLELCVEPHWWTWTQCSTIPWNRSLQQAGVSSFRHQPHRLYHYFGAALAKPGLVRNFRVSKKKAFLLGLNWASETRLFPITYWHEVIPWITDCWPPQFAKWHRIFRRHSFPHVFFSAQDCLKEFAPRHPDIAFHWLPEAVVPENFDPTLPLAARDWGVLEMGRKYETYHSVLREALPMEPQHIHGRFFQPGAELRSSLARAKVLVCFPKSVSSPGEAGGIETLTPRYLEGMASGCLVIGQSPRELIDLFGFNPVIEVDWARPGAQIQDVLENPNQYQPMVDRNLQRLREVGTFNTRASTMLSVLYHSGYYWDASEDIPIRK